MIRSFTVRMFVLVDAENAYGEQLASVRMGIDNIVPVVPAI
jgi:hypothetical protein